MKSDYGGKKGKVMSCPPMAGFAGKYLFPYRIQLLKMILVRGNRFENLPQLQIL